MGNETQRFIRPDFCWRMLCSHYSGNDFNYCDVNNPKARSLAAKKEDGMKKVYAVTSGSYSDYRISAIFSTKKLAQDFIDAVNDSDCNGIEEYDLDNDTADLIKRGYSVYRIQMLINGDTESCVKTDNDRYDVANCPDVSIWKRTKALAYIGKGMPDIMVATVWAKTEKAAIKIANEKRVQMIESGEFK